MIKIFVDVNIRKNGICWKIIRFVKNNKNNKKKQNNRNWSYAFVNGTANFGEILWKIKNGTQEICRT